MTTEPPGGDPWQVATVTQIRPETSHAKTFRLALASPTHRLAGQHYVRETDRARRVYGTTIVFRGFGAGRLERD